MFLFQIGIIADALKRVTELNFSPAQIFARFEPVTQAPAEIPPSIFTTYTGIWYEVNDLSTLFQDVDGLVPVTTVGQKVARINDKGTFGNHLTEATVGNQPTLGQDSRGRYYLQFNAAQQQRLRRASFIGMSTGTTPTYLAVAGKRDSGTGYAWLYARGTSAYVGSIFVGFFDTAPHSGLYANSVNVRNRSYGNPIVAAAQIVASANNNYYFVGDTRTPIKSSVIANIQNGAIQLGYQVNNAEYITGKFYGAIELNGTPTLREKEKIEYYLSDLVGYEIGNPDRRGCWYDFNDLTTMFQDTAMTIPAVVNQPVQAVMDKSGSNNHIFSNGGTGRPTLRYDAQKDKHYLEFNGTTNYLVRLGTQGIYYLPVGSETGTIYASVYGASDFSNYQTPYYRGQNSGGRSRNLYTIQGTHYSDNWGSGIIESKTPYGSSNDTVFFRREENNFAYVGIDYQTTVKRGNALDTFNDDTSPISVGRRHNDSSLYWNGRIYEILEVAGTINDLDHITLITYLKIKNGTLSNKIPPILFHKLPIVNPDASLGTTGWTGSSAGFTTSTTYAPIQGPYFIAGNQDPSFFYQDITIPSMFLSQVDQGSIISYLTWAQQGFALDDPGRVSLIYYDGSDVEISRITSSFIQFGQIWTSRSLLGAIPSNTRKIRIYCYCDRTSGTEASAYFDMFNLFMLDKMFCVTQAPVYPLVMEPVALQVTQVPVNVAVMQPVSLQVTQASLNTVIRQSNELNITQAPIYAIVRV